MRRLNWRQQRPLMSRQPLRRHPERRFRCHHTCHGIILVAGFLCIQWCEKLRSFASCARVSWVFILFYFHISRSLLRGDQRRVLFFHFFLFSFGPLYRSHAVSSALFMASFVPRKRGYARLGTMIHVRIPLWFCMNPDGK